MKRKLTALLLAMTFVFATVAPTVANGPAKVSANKTATVSVEKSKKEKSKFGAFIDKLTSPFTALFSTSSEVAGDSETSTDPKPEGTQPEDAKPAGAKPNKTGANNETSSQEANTPETGKPGEGGQTGSTEGGETNTADPKKEDKVEPVEFTFSLIDESNEQLPGVAFNLKNVTNKDASELKDTWITDGKPRELTLEPGKYQLKMTDSPKGYKETSAEFEIVKSEEPGEPDKFNIVSKTLTFDKDAKKLTMKAEKEPEKEKDEINTFFSLRDMAGKELSGAKLKIVKITEKDADKEAEETVKEWTSGNESVPYKLEKGKYRFVVASYPDDCAVEKSSIDFEINEKGEIVVAEADKGHVEPKDGNQTLFMVAERLGDRIYFALEDSYGKALSGLELKIEGNNGKVINLVSGEGSIGVKVTDLPDGTYVFSQTNVRYGHEAAEPIRFTVKDGKVVEASSGLVTLAKYQELTLVSKNISSSNSVKRVVTFSRVDSLGKLLIGTEIEIYKEGTKIASWKSGSDNHKLELEAGIYKYHEASIVLGHKIAKDFEFEVKTDGSIVLRGIQLGEVVKLKEGGHICVGEPTSKPVEDPNKKPGENSGQKPTTDTKNQAKNHWVEFNVAKKDGTLLDGAVVEIYKNGKLLESWTTSTTGYKTQLEPGTYRFHTKTAPKGYQLARDFNFGVNRDGTITLGKLQSGDTVTAKAGKIIVYGDPVSATGARINSTGTTSAAPGNGRLPKTGDGISPVFYAVGLAAVGAVILGFGIKKRRESVDEVK